MQGVGQDKLGIIFHRATIFGEPARIGPINQFVTTGTERVLKQYWSRVLTSGGLPFLL